jgi:hypothetical protein
MRRSQLDIKRSRVWVARLKGSLSVEHPISGDELRAIRRYLATREENRPWLFISERQATADPTGRELHRPARRRQGEARARLAAHAPPLVWLLPSRQGHGFTYDAGLPRAPRPQAHGALHARCRASVRGVVEVEATPPARSWHLLPRAEGFERIKRSPHALRWGSLPRGILVRTYRPQAPTSGFDPEAPWVCGAGRVT